MNYDIYTCDGDGELTWPVQRVTPKKVYVLNPKDKRGATRFQLDRQELETTGSYYNHVASLMFFLRRTS